MTAQHRADEAARETHARYRKVFDHAATGIAITDLGGSLQECNAAYARLLGYSRGELRGRTTFDLVHPDDRAATVAASQPVTAGTIPSCEIESRCLTREGRVVWARNIISLVLDTAGNPSQMIMLVTDRTRQKAAEQDLRRSQDEPPVAQDAARAVDRETARGPG